MRVQDIWYLRRRFSGPPRPVHDDQTLVECRLPWGMPLSVWPEDEIGRKILKLGLFDLAVCEAIARIVSPGDTVVDVGANCGQMTSLMAKCAGSTGRVFAFEPHPKNHALLVRNVEAWRKNEVMAVVAVHQVALAASPGTAVLAEPPGFERNSGLARIESRPDQGGLAVRTERLDSILPKDADVSLIKIDVEGAEAQVLDGATELLASGRLRNIVFEEHDQRGSVVIPRLRSLGYTVFSINVGLFGPSLFELKDGGSSGRGTNFLATYRREEAERRFKGIGYRSLMSRSGQHAPA